MAVAEKILNGLQRIVGADNVLTAPEDLIPYSFDGTAGLQQLPGCVVFAKTTEHVAGVLAQANETNTALVTRGSGTGLSGAACRVPIASSFARSRWTGFTNWTGRT